MAEMSPSRTSEPRAYLPRHAWWQSQGFGRAICSLGQTLTSRASFASCNRKSASRSRPVPRVCRVKRRCLGTNHSSRSRTRAKVFRSIPIACCRSRGKKRKRRKRRDFSERWRGAPTSPLFHFGVTVRLAPNVEIAPTKLGRGYRASSTVICGPFISSCAEPLNCVVCVDRLERTARERRCHPLVRSNAWFFGDGPWSPF